MLVSKKNEYFNKLLAKANKNTAEIWKIIRIALSSKKRPEKIHNVLQNGIEINNEQEIADKFSLFFKHQGQNLVKDLVKTDEIQNEQNTDRELDHKLKLQPVTPKTTFNILKSFDSKNSCGADNIPSKLINKCASQLTKPMNFIMNKSYSEGIFPSLLKVSKITPIFKQGSLELVNFRPINQLPTMSKVIEKGAIGQVNEFMDKFHPNLNQFGFKEKHSTLHPVIMIRHDIEMTLQNNQYCMIITCDLSKAFDSICTENRIYNKMSSYGFDQTSINFYKTFLTKRYHYVDWNGKQSKITDLFNIGIVQGSTSGPRLFNLYLQDINKVAQKCSIYNFADDTVILISSKNIDELEQITNSELEKINQYFVNNNLVLNLNKTCYMVLKPQRKKKKIRPLDIKIDKNTLKEVEQFKYLGIWLDNKLSFKYHHKMITEKLQSTINMLICTKDIFNYRTKKTIYDSCFKTYLDYCAPVWMDKLNKTQLKELFLMQKKAVRLCFSARYNSHTKTLFDISKITPVNEIFPNEAIKFIFKYLNDQQPEMIKQVIESDSRSLRSTQTNKIKIPEKIKKENVFYSIINEWNITSDKIRESGNISTLKKLLSEKSQNNILSCKKRECYICRKDSNINYIAYSEK